MIISWSFQVLEEAECKKKPKNHIKAPMYVYLVRLIMREKLTVTAATPGKDLC